MTQQLAQKICFKIEYALIQKTPQDLNQALLAINEQNRHTHKLYINEKDAQDDADSCGTVRDE